MARRIPTEYESRVILAQVAEQVQRSGRDPSWVAQSRARAVEATRRGGQYLTAAGALVDDADAALATYLDVRVDLGR